MQPKVKGVGFTIIFLCERSHTMKKYIVKLTLKGGVARFSEEFRACVLLLEKCPCAISDGKSSGYLWT